MIVVQEKILLFRLQIVPVRLLCTQSFKNSVFITKCLWTFSFSSGVIPDTLKLKLCDHCLKDLTKSSHSANK